MKKTILLLFILASCFSFGQLKESIVAFPLMPAIEIFEDIKKTGKTKIWYSEYHASKNLASENENEESLYGYVKNFEKEEGVRITNVYTHPMTDNSKAFFFALSELDENQKLNFISGRLEQMNKFQINRAIRMFANPPKTLSTYISGISSGAYKYTLWTRNRTD